MSGFGLWRQLSAKRLVQLWEASISTLDVVASFSICFINCQLQNVFRLTGGNRKNLSFENSGFFILNCNFAEINKSGSAFNY
jgi:hypothetical protein